MRKAQFVFAAALAAALLATRPGGLVGQGSFQIVTGKAFDSALPHDFYLEGNAIPTEKRNAVLLTSPRGARVVFSLLDTSGYSSQIQQKYVGLLITEGPLAMCGKTITVGSYGFGLQRPGPESKADAKFFLYDQAGKRVAECASKKDTAMSVPTPLQVRRVISGRLRRDGLATATGPGETRLYLGRYWLGLR